MALRLFRTHRRDSGPARLRYWNYSDTMIPDDFDQAHDSAGLTAVGRFLVVLILTKAEVAW
jgi:hypothetical protein